MICICHSRYKINTKKGIQCDATRWEQFCGDVFLDSFNKASRDEDKILDQIYRSMCCSNFFKIMKTVPFSLHHTEVPVWQGSKVCKNTERRRNTVMPENSPRPGKIDMYIEIVLDIKKVLNSISFSQKTRRICKKKGR